MHRFEAITNSDLAPPAQLELPWLHAEQEMDMPTLHDDILNTFITSLCLLVAKLGRHKEKPDGLQDITRVMHFVLLLHRRQ